MDGTSPSIIVLTGIVVRAIALRRIFLCVCAKATQQDSPG
jgi:hypothetical protein